MFKIYLCIIFEVIRFQNDQLMALSADYRKKYIQNKYTLFLYLRFVYVQIILLADTLCTIFAYFIFVYTGKSVSANKTICT